MLDDISIFYGIHKYIYTASHLLLSDDNNMNITLYVFHVISRARDLPAFAN